MTPYSPASFNQPRNALLIGAPPPVPSPQPGPAHLPTLLASTIGHAALLSDTPGKWASTIAMLKKNGVDPKGYEDFEKGRPAAMAAAGTPAPQEEDE